MNQFYILIYFCLIAQVLNAQAIPRDEYLEYLPLEHPKIIEQTSASKNLFLYGNKNSEDYIDDNPVDGIDDNRHNVLMFLAKRFSPYLVLNSESIPLDIKTFIENQDSFPLHIDVWDVTKSKPNLVDTDLIDFAKLGQSDCNIEMMSKQGLDFNIVEDHLNDDDCKLLNLINEFNPKKPKSRQYINGSKSMEDHRFKVMYFDFPGEDPESWKAVYQNEFTNLLRNKFINNLKVYVHPFIKEYKNHLKDETQGYELIFQYWFFYPYNDGGNNHEGDWEHINVVVSPKNKVELLLDEKEMISLLQGNGINNSSSDSEIVIKRLEYYFHHQVMPLDFSNPNVYLKKDEWDQQKEGINLERYGESNLFDLIRYRAYKDDDEKHINTHPIVFVGGDNKGFDQVMSMPGGTNRDSHGSYPFEGLFRNIGPAGASEQIYSYLDHKEFFEVLVDGEYENPRELERGAVVGFTDESYIQIVPDWERVINLVQTDSGARQDWSWLVLPLRWGYPATESPFAGIVKYADTGNQGDIGPQFTTWWNTSLEAADVELFIPHIIPPIFPLGFQDSFDNNLGFLNLTYPVFLNLPPVDVIWRMVVYPFRSIFDKYDPVYYPDEEIPSRFFDIAFGYSHQNLDDNFIDAVINSRQSDEFLGSLITHLIVNADSNTEAISDNKSLSKVSGPVFQINFHIGDQFTSENSIRNFHADIKLDATFNNIPSYVYTSELNFWEYYGSLKYNLTNTNIRPFIKIGYGWSWYRVQNASANGVKFTEKNSIWFNSPSFNSLKDILPNTFHAGLGVEAIIYKNFAGVDLSLKAEYSYFSHKLGVDFSKLSLEKLNIFFSNLNEIPQSATVVRHNFNLILAIGF